MTLPDDFNAWEHLKEMLMASHNRNVAQAFTGIPDGDLTTSLGGMKVACLLEPDDTVDMFLLRLFLFYFVYKGQLPQPIFAINISEYQARLKNKPQITLEFLEDWSEFLLLNKLPRATAEISFRLMHETGQTLNPEKALTWATRIKEMFMAGSGFTWEKGKELVLYDDFDNGFSFQVYASSRSEGSRVIERVVELAGGTVQTSLFRTKNLDNSEPEIPEFIEVYGQEVREQRRYPITRVHFVRATLHIPKYKIPITLIDRTGKMAGLVSA